MVQCKHTTYAWPELHGHLLLSNSHTGSCSVLWPFPFCGGGFAFTPKPAHDMCHVEVWPNCLKACEEEQKGITFECSNRPVQDRSHVLHA